MNTRAKILSVLRIGLLVVVVLLVLDFVGNSLAMAQEPSANSDNCIACHTDKEQVQSLAKDEEITSEASSGEG